MDYDILGSKIAIVGGGEFCLTMLEFFHSDVFEDRRPEVIAVADINPDAPGLQWAQVMGIPTTDNYTEFYAIDDLDTIIELTRDINLAEIILETKPPHIRLIDHFEARSLSDSLQIEVVRRTTLKRMEQQKNDVVEIEDILKELCDRFARIIIRRNNRSREIEMDLVEHEKTLRQIIQGSTIPTFVINQDHVVTHWNKAMERLTEIPAEKIIGTRRQWAPFYGQERPTMADVIIDQIQAEEVEKLYPTNWRKSALIEGAFEAEGFFPRLGEDGKWCWFTAAPIKAPDGTIVGAIETLWDKTEDKNAEEERERHTTELSTLCTIYTALSASLDIEGAVNQAIQEVSDFMDADGVCVYLEGPDGRFHFRYGYGFSEAACAKLNVVDDSSIISRVAEENRFTIFEDLPEGCSDEICFLEEQKLKSLAYIPISSKEKHTFGVIRIGSRLPNQFTRDQKNVLELIGNRIGVAIENAMLQEQSRKSEEKYRSLFNNDPNPIFILEPEAFQILDMNQRARDDYGYIRSEFLELAFSDLGDKDDEEIIQGLKRLSEGESVLFSKKRHYRNGQRPFYVNINVSYARYGGTNVLVATTTDITESVEKETQLVQASKMSTLGQMAAGIAHEINQPLNVIQVCADFFQKMIKRGQQISEEDLASLSEDIGSNVQRASSIIQHMRDFARQSDVGRTKIDINAPIQDVFKVMGHQLKMHQIELVLELDPDLPLIMADHNRLEQVFINLVTNALDAMDEKERISEQGDVEKRLTIQSFSRNGAVVVTVTDTGIGMSQDVINKIFEPFYTTKDVGKGTGLGVSISYGIVKDYDGTIRVSSQAGKGTTFELAFPSAA